MLSLRHTACAVLILVTASCEPAGESSTPLEPGFDHVLGLAGPRPFHGQIDGQLTFVPPFEPGSLATCNANFSGDPAHPGPSVSAFDEAQGVFSVIGRIRLASAFCFDPEAPDSEGTGVLTALNGDQIFIGFTNTAGAATAEGMIPVVGSQWITGGTGRFSDASGDQACHFLVNGATLQIRGFCQGEIRFDPSGH